MFKSLTMLSVLAMLASAFALHLINYQSRQLEQQVREKEQFREKLVEEIAILRADRAFLARPARIEAAARSLGMRAADSHQLPHGKNGDRVSKLGSP